MSGELSADTVSDQELFDSALQGSPGDNPAPEPPASVQPRNEQGQYAAPQPETAPGPAPAPEGEPERAGFVPSSRLKEEADKRRDLERRLEEMERRLVAPQKAAEPEAPKDPIETLLNDPNGFIRSELRPVVEEFSKELVLSRHDPATVQTAYDALFGEIRAGNLDGQKVGEFLGNSRHPWGEIMKWYEGHKVRSNPAEFERQTVEKFVADPANREFVSKLLSPQQAAAPAASTNVVKLPPSLNRTTSGAANAAPSDEVPGDAALFESITSRQRR